MATVINTFEDTRAQSIGEGIGSAGGAFFGAKQRKEAQDAVARLEQDMASRIRNSNSRDEASAIMSEAQYASVLDDTAKMKFYAESVDKAHPRPVKRTYFNEEGILIGDFSPQDAPTGARTQEGLSVTQAKATGTRAKEAHETTQKAARQTFNQNETDALTKRAAELRAQADEARKKEGEFRKDKQGDRANETVRIATNADLRAERIEERLQESAKMQKRVSEEQIETQDLQQQKLRGEIDSQALASVGLPDTAETHAAMADVAAYGLGDAPSPDAPLEDKIKWKKHVQTAMSANRHAQGGIDNLRRSYSGKIAAPGGGFTMDITGGDKKGESRLATGSGTYKNLLFHGVPDSDAYSIALKSGYALYPETVTDGFGKQTTKDGGVEKAPDGLVANSKGVLVHGISKDNPSGTVFTPIPNQIYDLGKRGLAIFIRGGGWIEVSP